KPLLSRDRRARGASSGRPGPDPRGRHSKEGKDAWEHSPPAFERQCRGEHGGKAPARRREGGAVPPPRKAQAAPTPAARSPASVTAPTWQHSAGLPSTSTIGTRFTPASRARSAAFGSSLRLWITTSHDGQAIRFTISTTGSQTEHPAANTSTRLFVAILPLFRSPSEHTDTSGQRSPGKRARLRLRRQSEWHSWRTSPDSCAPFLCRRP